MKISTIVTADIADFKQRTMITFSKQNSTQAYVLRNDQRIGLLEQTLGGYLLSINYSKPVFIPDKGKKIIKHLAESQFEHSIRMAEMHYDSNRYYIELCRNSVPRDERIYKD